MRSKVTAIIIFVFMYSAMSSYSFAQININLPKLPKIGKPKTDSGKNGNSEITNRDAATARQQNQTVGNEGKNIYPPQRPTSTPVLLKNSVYVQAITHNEYWKMPNQRNYSSWVPRLRFEHFYNNDKKLNYTVEYFNPDGSAWYSETLEQGNSAADRTVRFESPSPYGGVIDTKSTNAVGLFSFKITDQDTKLVIFQGKFKVGKFSTSYDGREKNKFDFFVDHDWLMPYGIVGFHHSIDPVGGMMPEVSVWLKGPVDASELEGRVYYKGQQIASTKDADGGGASDYDERTTQFAASNSPLNFWKRWQFQWNNLRFDNNGTFNRDYYPRAHYADKNPGEYTVKIFRGGTQIRELSFTVGPDGKFVLPAYTAQIFLPYYRIIVPVKVMGTAEKWNVSAWKADSFYGNPLPGFEVQ